MFGLEDQKKKNRSKTFEYDLEVEFNKATYYKEVKARAEAQVQKLKDVLRKGEEKESFDKIGTLLHGYTSLLKVMSRFNPKN